MRNPTIVLIFCGLCKGSLECVCDLVLIVGGNIYHRQRTLTPAVGP
jgi:hypothetical protein